MLILFKIIKAIQLVFQQITARNSVLFSRTSPVDSTSSRVSIWAIRSRRLTFWGRIFGKKLDIHKLQIWSSLFLNPNRTGLVFFSTGYNSDPNYLFGYSTRFSVDHYEVSRLVLWYNWNFKQHCIYILKLIDTPT